MCEMEIFQVSSRHLNLKRWKKRQTWRITMSMECDRNVLSGLTYSHCITCLWYGSNEGCPKPQTSSNTTEIQLNWHSAFHSTFSDTYSIFANGCLSIGFLNHCRKFSFSSIAPFFTYTLFHTNCDSTKLYV